MTLALESLADRVRFRVKVQARAHRQGIAGVHDGALRVRVTAPPLEGRANRAVVELLAKCLHLPTSSIKIAAGERARLKVIEVAGLNAATLLKRLRP